MRIKIQIKSKGDDGWQPINPAEVGGPTLREALSGFAEKMVVAEIDINEMKYYYCGTHHLQTMMAGRGRSFTTQETGSLLDSINPGILDLPLRVDTGRADIRRIAARGDLC